MKSIIGILIGVVLLLAAAMLWFGSKNTSTNASRSNAIGVQQTRDSMSEVATGQNSIEALSDETAADLPPGVYSDEQYDQFKEDYNCELAENAKAQCEAVDRGSDGLEKCLKLSQYYTYSRHCGEQPE